MLRLTSIPADEWVAVLRERRSRGARARPYVAQLARHSSGSEHTRQLARAIRAVWGLSPDMLDPLVRQEDPLLTDASVLRSAPGPAIDQLIAHLQRCLGDGQPWFDRPWPRAVLQTLRGSGRWPDTDARLAEHVAYLVGRQARALPADPMSYPMWTVAAPVAVGLNVLAPWPSIRPEDLDRLVELCACTRGRRDAPDVSYIATFVDRLADAQDDLLRTLAGSRFGDRDPAQLGRPVPASPAASGSAPVPLPVVTRPDMPGLTRALGDRRLGVRADLVRILAARPDLDTEPELRQFVGAQLLEVPLSLPDRAAVWSTLLHTAPPGELAEVVRGALAARPSEPPVAGTSGRQARLRTSGARRGARAVPVQLSPLLQALMAALLDTVQPLPASVLAPLLTHPERSVRLALTALLGARRPATPASALAPGAHPAVRVPATRPPRPARAR